MRVFLLIWNTTPKIEEKKHYAHQNRDIDDCYYCTYFMFYFIYFFVCETLCDGIFRKEKKYSRPKKDKSISAHENQPTKPEKLSSHVIGCGGARAFSCIVLQLLNDLCSVMFIFVCHSFIACYMCTFFPFHHMCTVYASWRYYYTFLSHKGFWLVPFQAVNRKHITQ